jgi:hypothetical protein
MAEERNAAVLELRTLTVGVQIEIHRYKRSFGEHRQLKYIVLSYSWGTLFAIESDSMTATMQPLISLYHVPRNVVAGLGSE